VHSATPRHMVGMTLPTSQSGSLRFGEDVVRELSELDAVDRVGMVRIVRRGDDLQPFSLQSAR